MGRLILITGGARAGKSRFAQDLAGKLSKRVLFVATAEALDADMRVRIAEHRKNRPPRWKTLEASHDIGRQIEQNTDKLHVVIVDCITMLLNNIFNECSEDGEPDAASIEKKLKSELRSLISVITKEDAVFLVVTNEVGSGIVPDNAAARIFRDLMGYTNQTLGVHADEVYMLVAGIPVSVK